MKNGPEGKFPGTLLVTDSKHNVVVFKFIGIEKKTKNFRRSNFLRKRWVVKFYVTEPESSRD